MVIKQRVFPLFGCAVAGVMAFVLSPLQAQTTIVEANFEAVNPGGRIAEGENHAGVIPQEGRFNVGHVRDEVVVVKGWDGSALQFQDLVEGSSARLVFGSRDMGAITSGTLEASLDFRINGSPPPYSGHPLQVLLYEPEAGYLLQVLVLGQDGKIAYTNRDTPPAHQEMANGEVARPGVVYQLKLTVSLDRGTYDLELTEKEGGNAVWKAEKQLFVKPAGLAQTGVGRSILNIIAGSPDFSQDIDPPVTVTVDNILVRHLP